MCFNSLLSQSGHLSHRGLLFFLSRVPCVEGVDRLVWLCGATVRRPSRTPPPSEGPCAEYWSQHGCFHNFLSEALLVVNSGFLGGRPYYNSNNLTQQRGHNNQKSSKFRVQKEHLFHCIKLVLLEMLRRQFCNICSPVMFSP